MRFALRATIIAALAALSSAGLADEHPGAPAEPMTNARLATILERVAPEVEGQAGRWRFTRDDIPVMVLTDESHNRMRVIAPIAKRDQVDAAVLERMMQANFASALDARYALYQDIVWAAFIHPLDSLLERDFVTSLEQVVTLVKTTGTTYSSTDLGFGGDYGGEQPAPE